MKNERRSVSLEFGALSDPIPKQLRAQGLSFKAKEGKRWEATARAITMCFLQGVHTESETNKARGKLAKVIVAGVSIDRTADMKSSSPSK